MGVAETTRHGQGGGGGGDGDSAASNACESALTLLSGLNFCHLVPPASAWSVLYPQGYFVTGWVGVCSWSPVQQGGGVYATVEFHHSRAWLFSGQ